MMRNKIFIRKRDELQNFKHIQAEKYFQSFFLSSTWRLEFIHHFNLEKVINNPNPISSNARDAPTYT